MPLYKGLTQRQEQAHPVWQQIISPLQTVARLRAGLPQVPLSEINRLRAELEGMRNGSIESRKLLAGLFLPKLPRNNEEILNPQTLEDLHLALRQEERITPIPDNVTHHSPSSAG